MFDLPFQTYRFLIKSIPRTKHLRKTIIRRFLKFIESLSKSKKPIIKSLLEVCKDSTLSTTGRNIGGINLLSGAIDDIMIDCTSLIEYFPVADDNIWKVELLEDLCDEVEIRKLDDDEIELLDYSAILSLHNI